MQVNAYGALPWAGMRDAFGVHKAEKGNVHEGPSGAAAAPHVIASHSVD